MNNMYIYIIVYLLILFSIVFYLQKKETKEDFLIAGRDRNWWNIMFSKFAWAVWMAWFLSYTAYAYEYWFWVYIVVLGFILWYALFAFWVVPKIYSIANNNNFYTQGDLVEYNTNCNISKKITDIYSSIVQFVWLLTSIIWWAKVIESLWLMTYEISALIILFIVLTYIILWWYKVVIVTDIFQGFVIIVLLFIISFGIINWSNISDVINEETSRLSIASIIWFFLYWILSILALSDRYQLCYSAKDEKSIQKWMFLTFIPILLVASLLLFIGLFMHLQNPNLDPSLVFLEAIKINLSESLLPIWIVLFFSGLMSSADTYIYTISSHLSFLWKKKDSIKNIKRISILLVIFTYIIVYFFRDIIWVTIFWAGLSLVMSIPMIYIIKWWKNNYKFLYSVFWWIAGLFLWIIFLWLKPSIAIIVLIWWLLGLLYNKNFKL